MEVWIWLFFFLVVLPYIVLTYNEFVSLKAQTDAQKSNIESQLVRRANLYEKMASTLAAGTKFEKDFQKEIAQIRESGSGGIDKAAQVGERFKMMVARLEATPDIKAIGMMRDMQSDAEKTEDLIQIAKETFNSKAANYNAYVRQFPSILVAMMFGFRKLTYIHDD